MEGVGKGGGAAVHIGGVDDAAVLHDLDLHIAVAAVLLGDVEHHHPLSGAGALADGEHDLRAGLHLGALLDALADMIQEQLDTTLGQYSLGLENLSQEAEEQKNIQDKISSRKQEIQQLRTYQRGLYEGLIQNHLSKDEYFTLKEKYEAKIETNSKEIEQLKAGLTIIAKQLEQYKMLSQDAQHIKEDRQLTAALIDRLIDRVEVSREKRITVHFRFQSEFEHCKEVLSQCRNM